MEKCVSAKTVSIAELGRPALDRFTSQKGRGSEGGTQENHGPASSRDDNKAWLPYRREGSEERPHPKCDVEFISPNLCSQRKGGKSHSMARWLSMGWAHSPSPPRPGTGPGEGEAKGDQEAPRTLQRAELYRLRKVAIAPPSLSKNRGFATPSGLRHKWKSGQWRAASSDRADRPDRRDMRKFFLAGLVQARTKAKKKKFNTSMRVPATGWVGTRRSRPATAMRGDAREGGRGGWCAAGGWTGAGKGAEGKWGKRGGGASHKQVKKRQSTIL
ncbi:uncharacterized protein VTP21DRAFT_3417 [Calcarisporiella thermophila]|uniref:uncharacterized protein n=1 Tax=Calcarisporiella thermophila TaxID=911321 RepID=UPI003742E72D